MTKAFNRRRFLEAGGSLLAVASMPHTSLTAESKTTNDAKGLPWLGPFAEAYMQRMYAPGMIVATVNGEQLGGAAFGLGSLEARAPVTLQHSFCIGSITKSFVGLIAMQLRDEGKLDVHQPVHEIMPELPFTEKYGAVTAHHLLTHTSGLPNWQTLLPNDPSQIATQAYAPGVKFHYSNLGFDTLGKIIHHVDGRSWPDAVKARIFDPLDMVGAASVIDDVTQLHMPTGYAPLFGDRPNAVSYPLVPSGRLRFAIASGSISATAADMGKYMRMLAAHGVGPNGRIISPEGFDLFSTPWIPALDLSPNASYGYGIGVETIDGHKSLRHTGGMTAFASSLVVDLESATGAFASINSMQGYRPNPITLYSVKALNAHKAGKQLPSPPLIDNPLEVSNAADFIGKYMSREGDVVSVITVGKNLFLKSEYGTSPLLPVGNDTFSMADGSALPHTNSLQSVKTVNDFAVPCAFPVVFGRDDHRTDETPTPPGVFAITKGAIEELSIGSRWYGLEKRLVSPRPEAVVGAASLVGTYTSDSPWVTVIRVVERNGKLWMNGKDEMRLKSARSFMVNIDSFEYEMTFSDFLDGVAHALGFRGQTLQRLTF